MLQIKYIFAISIAVMAGAYSPVGFSSDEDAQLGGASLTLTGSEKAGNKDGTIPPYTGEIVKTPPGNIPGEYSDPWNEKPLFTITAQNADKYLDKLDAQREMFKRYPNYRMDIYPTHRTAAYSKSYLDNTQKNVSNCKTINGELQLQGCYGGMPFPIPKTGAEVVWNHLLSYNHLYAKADFESYIVTRDGNAVLQVRNEATLWYPLLDPDRKETVSGSDIYWAYHSLTTGPARRVGEKLLILDAVDSLNIGRRAWQYIPGQRRVKLAPDLAYDTPSPYGAGSVTMDESRGFMGALDRFEWKLGGKKEKFIIANSYRTEDYKKCPPEVILTKDFINPDCVRWELHRVWKVVGTLKPAFRHIYKKRIMYWDEDGFCGGSTENYDASGNLYRLGYVISYPYYDGQGQDCGATIHHDLQTGVYAAQAISNRKGLGFYPLTKIDKLQFSPEALAGEGLR